MKEEKHYNGILEQWGEIKSGIQKKGKKPWASIGFRLDND